MATNGREFRVQICQLAALVRMLSVCAAINFFLPAVVEPVGALTTYAVPSPGVLCTTEDSIGVTYLTERSNDQHVEAMQLICAHCTDGFI